MKTTHKSDCKRVFKNYDHSCPRCLELIAGSPARAGWNDLKKQQEARRIQDIHDHFAPGGPHAQGHCGPVCTAFDW